MADTCDRGAAEATAAISKGTENGFAQRCDRAPLTSPACSRLPCSVRNLGAKLIQRLNVTNPDRVMGTREMLSLSLPQKPHVSSVCAERSVQRTRSLITVAGPFGTCCPGRVFTSTNVQVGPFGHRSRLPQQTWGRSCPRCAAGTRTRIETQRFHQSCKPI